MGKAEETRKRIIANAAELFNVQGYSGTAISDVMSATGLKKGGIYTHFNSKEDLAIAAFDYSYEQIERVYRDIFEEHRGDPMAQLIGTIEVYRNMDSDSPIKGGCPLLNTAIESDDNSAEDYQKLKRRAQAVMRRWQSFIKRIVRDGIEAGVMNSETDADEIATLVIASLEGGLMMSKLMNNPAHLNQMVDMLIARIETELAI